MELDGESGLPPCRGASGPQLRLDLQLGDEGIVPVDTFTHWVERIGTGPVQQVGIRGEEAVIEIHSRREHSSARDRLRID